MEVLWCYIRPWQLLTCSDSMLRLHVCKILHLHFWLSSGTYTHSTPHSTTSSVKRTALGLVQRSPALEGA